MRDRIPVFEPLLDERETSFVNSALQSQAISGFYGEFIGRFENEFAMFCDAKYAVAVTSGTTAIHLALIVADVGPKDEVLVATYTNMASFFPVIYQGAIPIPIDIDPETWNIDHTRLESKITPRTKAIIVVHIFGHPVDMDPILEVAKKHGLVVIEDCAEAHGATYKGKKVGALGDIGCFSFYANKIITTGEGGMLTTNNSSLAERARSVKSLAFGKINKFMHTEIGYNYRMTNLQAAIGCAQMEKIDGVIEKKRALADRYNNLLSNTPCLRKPIERSYARNVYWMYHLVLEPDARINRDLVMTQLAEQGIETRPGFTPFNMQNIFIQQGLANVDDCPVANYVGMNSFYLPSSPQLTEEESVYVIKSLLKIVAS